MKTFRIIFQSRGEGQIYIAANSVREAKILFDSMPEKALLNEINLEHFSTAILEEDAHRDDRN